MPHNSRQQGECKEKQCKDSERGSPTCWPRPQLQDRAAVRSGILTLISWKKSHETRDPKLLVLVQPNFWGDEEVDIAQLLFL